MANSDQKPNSLQSQNYNNCEMLDYIDNDIRKYFNDFTLEKHLICKPPDEAFLFFPKEEELYVSNEINESKVFRKIFGVKNFTKYETEILSKFEAFIANFNELNENRQIVFNEDWERWDTLKFLEAADYEFKKALQSISDYLDWRSVYFPIELSDKAIKILAFSGFIYCHGRDHNYRPNIFIKAEIYYGSFDKYSFDDWQMALVFFCEYIIQNMLIPGQVEQWNLFVDLENLNLETLSEDMEKLIKFFKEYYISRVNLIFVFSMSKRLEGVYKLLLTLLEAPTKNKIIFINESNQGEIFTKCNMEQIEQKYGGTAKNIYETVLELEKNIESLRNNISNSSIDVSDSRDSNIIYFFPPIIPNKNFKLNLRKKFSKSLDRQNSLGKMKNKNHLSPNINCATVNIFSTPKANSSKNNVFVYNPNNYKCIQMSELSGKNFDRNAHQDNLVSGTNQSCFAKLSNNNVERNTSEVKEIPSKLMPKPLNLTEISEPKIPIKIEQRSQTLQVKSSSNMLNRSRKEEKDLIEKIIEKDEEYDSSLYEDAISIITFTTNNANEGETSSSLQRKSSQRRMSSNVFYTARDYNELTNSSNVNTDKSGKNFIENLIKNRSSKKFVLDFDDKCEKTVSEGNSNTNANSVMDIITRNNSRDKNNYGYNENINFLKTTKTQDSYTGEINMHSYRGEISMQNRHEESADSLKNNENSFDLIVESNSKERKNSCSNNNNDLSHPNNSKLLNDNRFASNNNHKLSTILEDNEILNHLSLNSKNAYVVSNENTSDTNVQNKAFNDSDNVKNNNTKSQSKNKNKKYSNSKSNSDRLIESLSNKINININNNININFNVSNINNVSEQFMSQGQNSSGDFNDKMQFFMNRTIYCERNSKINLSNEDLNSSLERHNKFGSKYSNSQSHPDIKKRSNGDSDKKDVKTLIKIPKNDLRDTKSNDNCNINTDVHEIIFNDKSIKSKDNQETKEKEKVVIEANADKTNEVKNKTVDSKVEKTDKNKLIKNSPDISNNKIEMSVNKETDSKPKNDRASNFANFFQRLTKTSQMADSNVKQKEETLKNAQLPVKQDSTNQSAKKNEEILNKKLEEKEADKKEIPINPEKEIKLNNQEEIRNNENIITTSKLEDQISTKVENHNEKIELSKEAILPKHQENGVGPNITDLENKVLEEKEEEAAVIQQKQQENKEIVIRELSLKEQSLIQIDPNIEHNNEDAIKTNPQTIAKDNTFKDPTDSPNPNFNQNEIRQNLLFENKLIKKNTKLYSTKNVSHLHKNNINEENQISKDESDKLFEKLNNEFNEEDFANPKFINKTNTAQSFGLEPNKDTRLLTSRDHVVSVEEEINRCLKLRRKERSDSGTHSNILFEKLAAQLKEKVCKQTKIKMYNMKLTKTPILNSSITWQENKTNSNFGLANQMILNDNVNEKSLDSQRFKTILHTALGRGNASNGDTSKKDLCQGVLARIPSKQNAESNLLVQEEEKEAPETKTNNSLCTQKKENLISVEDNKNINFILNNNVDNYFFDEEMKEEIFDDIFTDEVKEGDNFKDSVSFKMNNELLISKNKLDRHSFNVDCIDKFSFNNCDQTKNLNESGNENFNRPSKTYTLNNNSKIEPDGHTSNDNRTDLIQVPTKRRSVYENFNFNNQNKILQAPTFKKALDNNNLLDSTHNNDDSFYKSESANIKINSNTQNSKNNINNSNKETVNNYNNYSSSVQNGVNKNGNNYSLNTENAINTDIIMDKITKQPCCSNLNVEDKCFIF